MRTRLLLDLMHHARAAALHLMGLCSDGGVHSQQEHLYALLRMAKQRESAGGFHPLLHGWARHASRERNRLYPRSCSRRSAKSAWGRIATVSGPLLRDGSRQALGAHREGL